MMKFIRTIIILLTHFVLVKYVKSRISIAFCSTNTSNCGVVRKYNSYIASENLAADSQTKMITPIDHFDNVDHPEAFFDISIDGESVGKLAFELWSDRAPLTVRNFLSLCKGDKDKSLWYKGNKMHRIIPNFMLQGGDITRGDGTGGHSIYGEVFKDEYLRGKHCPHVLSMANKGPHTNGSQFFITFTSCPWLDGKHVVFGRVKSGIQVLIDIHKAATASGNPSKDVVIEDCGEAPPKTFPEQMTAEFRQHFYQIP
eukprot:GHVL01034067.1.p1 GENE.GHVL01034067.1~~GHVL01034067.1.p1  ORF type:complete len:256 (-),score=29.11 GHVL01034067.1:93-860(-)